MALFEQRSHARAPLPPLGVSAHGPQLHAPGSVAAQVLDISEGGVQIRSRPSQPLTGKSFHLQVLLGPWDKAELLDGGEIQCVWSHTEQMHSRSGFLVRADRQALAGLSHRLHALAPQVLHCLLRPVVASL